VRRGVARRGSQACARPGKRTVAVVVVERDHLLDGGGLGIEAQRLEGEQQLVLVNLPRAVGIVQVKRLPRLLLLLSSQPNLFALRLRHFK
jgi:hypothetical protein